MDENEPSQFDIDDEPRLIDNSIGDFFPDADIDHSENFNAKSPEDLDSEKKLDQELKLDETNLAKEGLEIVVEEFGEGDWKEHQLDDSYKEYLDPESGEIYTINEQTGLKEFTKDTSQLLDEYYKYRDELTSSGISTHESTNYDEKKVYGIVAKLESDNSISTEIYFRELTEEEIEAYKDKPMKSEASTEEAEDILVSDNKFDESADHNINIIDLDVLVRPSIIQEQIFSFSSGTEQFSFWNGPIEAATDTIQNEAAVSFMPAIKIETVPASPLPAGSPLEQDPRAGIELVTVTLPVLREDGQLRSHFIETASHSLRSVGNRLDYSPDITTLFPAGEGITELNLVKNEADLLLQNFNGAIQPVTVEGSSPFPTEPGNLWPTLPEQENRIPDATTPEISASTLKSEQEKDTIETIVTHAPETVTKDPVTESKDRKLVVSPTVPNMTQPNPVTGMRTKAMEISMPKEPISNYLDDEPSPPAGNTSFEILVPEISTIENTEIHHISEPAPLLREDAVRNKTAEAGPMSLMRNNKKESAIMPQDAENDAIKPAETGEKNTIGHLVPSREPIIGQYKLHITEPALAIERGGLDKKYSDEARAERQPQSAPIKNTFTRTPVVLKPGVPVTVSPAKETERSSVRPKETPVLPNTPVSAIKVPAKVKSNVSTPGHEQEQSRNTEKITAMPQKAAEPEKVKPAALSSEDSRSRESIPVERRALVQPAKTVASESSLPRRSNRVEQISSGKGFVPLNDESAAADEPFTPQEQPELATMAA